MNFCKNKIRLLFLLSGVAIIIIITCIIFAYECKLDTLSTKYSIDYAKKDSALNMYYDMMYIVESIFTNQGYKVPENISFKKKLYSYKSADFNNNTFFVYVSPLYCWSCVNTINGHIKSVINDRNLAYIIPAKYADEIDLFLDFIDIPSNNVYFISSKLGLPIEESNRVFLFTIEEPNIIKNVFPPSKYSREMTQAYINSVLTN